MDRLSPIGRPPNPQQSTARTGGPSARSDVSETAMRRGFTLFEIILVMAVLVILAGLSYPSLENMYGYYRVQAAADTLRGNWAEARTRAMEEGRPYRFAAVLGKGNFRVAPDGAEFWSGSDAAPADSGTPPLIAND